MRSRIPVWCSILSITACAPTSPIAWEDVRTLTGAVDDETIVRLDTASGAVLARAPVASVQTQGAVCAGSVRVATDGQGGLFAAWWAPRSDSSAALVVARRVVADSGAWGAPVVADARDRGRAGCARPAPGIAADAHRGYVHLAYYLDAPAGAGVYGGHSMESGSYFHDPVAIVYGDRPVAATIATSGDRVAVADEDPNSARSRIAVAVSLSAGHVYEHRTEASPASMRAPTPRVALDGRRLAVAWSAEAWEQGAQGTRAMVRVGTIGDETRPQSGGNEQ
jgi:hypothetical protein